MSTRKSLIVVLCIVITGLIYPIVKNTSKKNPIPKNVLVCDFIEKFYPDEPSIVISPYDTKLMLAGANGDYTFISKDAGETWKMEIPKSTLGSFGDPVLLADKFGAFYYFHLSNQPGKGVADRIVCQKRNKISENWNNGTGIGFNGSKFQDKEWAAIDPSNNNIYVTWTQFDVYNSDKPEDKTNIRFAKSTDGGKTWSDAKSINEIPGNCLDDDETVEGAVPAVGPNGEIYVSWSGPNGLVFDKSLDEGTTWLDKDINVSDHPGGWAINIPGIYRCNGMPVTCCDISNSENNGTIYINWVDNRNGHGNYDVFLAKSTDGGNTWSDPIRVNDDNTNKPQFFTWMTIDQSNGNLYCVFYDRRNHEDNKTDVYLAVSTDGGNSFANHKISESPFIPDSTVFFGDYNNISAVNNVVRPIWTRMDNKKNSIWTAIIDGSVF